MNADVCDFYSDDDDDEHRAPAPSGEFQPDNLNAPLPDETRSGSSVSSSDRESLEEAREEYEEQYEETYD